MKKVSINLCLKYEIVTILGQQHQLLDNPLTKPLETWHKNRAKPAPPRNQAQMELNWTNSALLELTTTHFNTTKTVLTKLKLKTDQGVSSSIYWWTLWLLDFAKGPQKYGPWGQYPPPKVQTVNPQQHTASSFRQIS